MIAVALGASATADAATKQFRTPSRNIGCLYSTSGGPGAFLRCDVLSEGDNGGFKLRRRARRIHITDTVYDNRSPVLQYGKRKRYGPFTCASRRSGLTCKRRSTGHGFKLSRQRQRLF